MKTRGRGGRRETGREGGREGDKGNAGGCSTYIIRPVMELYPLEAPRGKK